MSNNLPEIIHQPLQLIYTPNDQFWSGYTGESQQGMEYLRQSTGLMPYSFTDFADSLPKRVDPRSNPLFAKGWMRTENQGGVGACLPSRTAITMADGSTKTLNKVLIGDSVLLCDGTSEVVTDIITRFYTGTMVIVRLENGDEFELTETHGVYLTDDAIKPAVALSIGDELITETGPSKVVLIRTFNVAEEVVHNLSVRNRPEFFANGVLVTNCQGYGLVQCVEWLYAILTGQVVQLAPLFAYLMSQYFDGIAGDRGSTLSGGTKVLEKMGLCLLSVYPKERVYPPGGYRDVPQSAIDAAKQGPFKTLRTVRFRDAAEYRAFVGSMAGIAQTGTRWTRSMANPPGHGIIQSVGGASLGGHSWNFCGYIPIDEMGAEARRFIPKTRGQFMNLACNSHAVSYGDGGFTYYTDELFNELNKSDLILGRTDMGDIRPRPSKIDFTQRISSRFTRDR